MSSSSSSFQALPWFRAPCSSAPAASSLTCRSQGRVPSRTSPIWMAAGSEKDCEVLTLEKGETTQILPPSLSLKIHQEREEERELPLLVENGTKVHERSSIQVPARGSSYKDVRCRGAGGSRYQEWGDPASSPTERPSLDLGKSGAGNVVWIGKSRT